VGADLGGPGAGLDLGRQKGSPSLVLQASQPVSGKRQQEPSTPARVMKWAGWGASAQHLKQVITAHQAALRMHGR